MNVDGNGGGISGTAEALRNIFCPQYINSSYNGPNRASCMINLHGTNMDIAYSRFRTINGMPQDLWIDVADTATFKNRSFLPSYGAGLQFINRNH